jgi:hypothetical protein
MRDVIPNSAMVRKLGSLLAMSVFAAVLFAPRGSIAYPAILATEEAAGQNQESARVVLFRHAQKSVVTIQMKYQGASRRVGLIIPVPAAVTLSEVTVLRAQPMVLLHHYSSPVLRETWPAEVPDRYGGCCVASSVGPSKPGQILDSARRVQRIPDPYSLTKLEDVASVGQWLQSNNLELRPEARAAMSKYDGQFAFIVGAKTRPDGQTGSVPLTFQPIRFEFQSKEPSVPSWPSGINSERYRPMTTFVISNAVMGIRGRTGVGLSSNSISAD